MDNIKNFREDYSEDIRYSYDDFPIYISQGLLSMCPHYRFPSHWHDDIEFIAVLDGEMDYNINGETVHLTCGEGIIINSRQMHFGFSDAKNECEFLCVLLHPILLCSNSAYKKEFVDPVIQNSAISFIKLGKTEQWHKDIYDAILYIKQVEKEKTAPLKVQSTFGKIWSLIYENVPLEKRLESPDLNIIKDMIRFVSANYQEKISLKDIARSGGVGESKCCKLFRHYLKTTPNGYVIQYRLEKSAEMLKSSQLSVTEIASLVGFNGPSYFSESFRKLYGLTPLQYRMSGR